MDGLLVEQFFKNPSDPLLLEKINQNIAKLDPFLMSEIKQLLYSHKLESVMKLTKKDKNKQFFELRAHEIITLICSQINELAACECVGPKLLNELLESLANIGDPKSVLEVLLEGLTILSDAKHVISDALFLFQPIAVVLKKLPGKRGRSLEHILNLMYAHLSNKLASYNYEELNFLTSSLSNYLFFFEPFVEEVSHKAVYQKQIPYSNRIHQQREMLQRYLVKLFHEPLLFYEHHEKPQSSYIYHRISMLLTYLGKITTNVYKLFDLDLSGNEYCGNKVIAEKDRESQDLAFANLAFMMFAENNVLIETYQPHVYQHRFLFKKLVPLALLLWQNDNYVLKEKGFLLFCALIGQIVTSDLTTDYFSMEHFYKFCEVFANPSSLMHEKYNRDFCKVVMKLLDVSDDHRCYDFFLATLKMANRTDMHSISIFYYQVQLEKKWGSSGFHHYLGKNLRVFIENCLLYKDRSQVDVLYELKAISHFSEFVRSIVKKDPKRKNISGLWSFYPVLISEFFRPLLKSVKYTEMYCKKYKKSPKGIRLQKIKSSIYKPKRFESEFENVMKQNKYSAMHFHILHDMLSRNVDMM